MRLSKILLLLCTLCLTSCGKGGVRNTSYWEMSEEARVYYNNYKVNPDKDFLLPGKAFQDYLLSILIREDKPQEMPSGLKLTHAPTKSICNNQSVYTFEESNYESIVLYFHGGAYVYDALAVHFNYCDGLVDTLNSKVVMPLYGLAPQHLFSETYEMVENIYKELLKENKPIYVIGDSAGGGFSLAFSEYCIAKGIKAPDKIVMFSPWLDVTMVNPDIKNYEEVDTTLACYGLRVFGQFWAGTTDRNDYRISPIYGDLNNLPDILMFASNEEIVYPDILKLYENAKNTNIKLIVGKGYFHVFPIYPIPERQQSYSVIKEFVK